MYCCFVVGVGCVQVTALVATTHTEVSAVSVGTVGVVHGRVGYVGCFTGGQVVCDGYAAISAATFAWS